LADRDRGVGRRGECCSRWVLLPGAFLALRGSRAAQRSRERSLVGRSDRRAAWRTTAVWLGVASLIGSVPAVIDGRGDGYFADLFWWSGAEKACLAQGPLVVSLAGCAIAMVVALLDWRAERIVTRARAWSAEWRLDAVSVESASLDVGVGHDAWMQHVTGRTTYRENALERVVAVGDLGAGQDLLRKATRRSTVALAFVGAAELATVYVYARLLG